MILFFLAVAASSTTAPATVEPIAPASTPVEAAAAGPDTSTPSRPSRFSAPALGEAELRGQAGRADVSQDARNSQVAGVSGSSVNGTSRTGAVTIDGNAFQNMSGLTVVNANSGNNVAMNGAMTVNVAISPNP